MAAAVVAHRAANRIGNGGEVANQRFEAFCFESGIAGALDRVKKECP